MNWTEADYTAYLQRMGRDVVRGRGRIVTNWTESEYAAYVQRMGRDVVHGGHTPILSEKAFMAAMGQLAMAHGWKVFHPFDSRKSIPGYPDLTMAHVPTRQLPGGSLLMAEVKIEGEKPTIEQQAWLDVLQTITGIQCFLWRPSDWNVIESTLCAV